jgi:hypothetical protein
MDAARAPLALHPITDALQERLHRPEALQDTHDSEPRDIDCGLYQHVGLHAAELQRLALYGLHNVILSLCSV